MTRFLWRLLDATFTAVLGVSIGWLVLLAVRSLWLLCHQPPVSCWLRGHAHELELGDHALWLRCVHCKVPTDGWHWESRG